MNKMIVLLAVLAMTGCAETANEGAFLLGGGGHASSGGSDVASTPARAVAYESAPREMPARHAQRRDAEFVVCAQCRH